MAARPIAAIVCGGLTSGLVDIGTATVMFHSQPMVILRTIATGWLGRAAVKGGENAAMIGLASQVGISLIAAAVYVLAAMRFKALTRHWLIGGLVFGLCVYGVMNYVIVPLSASPLHPAKAVNLVVEGIAAHMILFGLPIAGFARLFLGGARGR